MEPINARERRIQFFKFVLLFLLAVVPITAVVYLYAQVDRVENDYLRKQYRAQKASGSFSENRGRLVNGLVDASKNLGSLVTDPRMMALDRTMSANVNTALGELEGAEEKLSADLRQAPDSILSELTDLALTYQTSVSTYNEIYTDASKRLKSSRDSLDILTRKLRQWQLGYDEVYRLVPAELQYSVRRPAP